jgi:hypothetical protein
MPVSLLILKLPGFPFIVPYDKSLLRKHPNKTA